MDAHPRSLEHCGGWTANEEVEGFEGGAAEVGVKRRKVVCDNYGRCKLVTGARAQLHTYWFRHHRGVNQYTLAACAGSSKL